MDRDATVGIVVPTWNRAAAALTCLDAVARLSYPRRFTVVVDNGSEISARATLVGGAAGRAGVQVLTLAENRGFAAGVNVGLAEVFGRGAVAALILNDDAEVAPDLLDALVGAAAADPGAGIVAPRVVDATSGCEVSRGEGVWLPLLCLPRTWLRVRHGGPDPYAVTGVLGVAFLVTRACYERIGPLAESFFAYYEEVDYCLRARAAGFRILVVPAASVRHAGFRGFAAGFTPLAAYLKARNLPLLVRRNGGGLDWAAFVPTYLALIAASAAVYATGGRGGAVLGALARGVADALRGRSGPPPAGLAPPPAGI
jgi:GT2 family glycosyltransferase